MSALDLFGRPCPSSRTASHARRLREVGQGALAVSDEPGVVLAATLGSCVSVCLHAPDAGMGGMNHIFQTVHERPGGDAGVVAELEALVNAFMQAGVARGALTARVAGGAHVLSHGRDYGRGIAQASLAYLAQEGIPVTGVSLGGTRARRVRFDPVDGRLSVALLAPSASLRIRPPVAQGNAPEIF